MDEDSQGFEDSQDSEDSQGFEDSQDFQDFQDSGDSQGFEGFQDPAETTEEPTQEDLDSVKELRSVFDPGIAEIQSALDELQGLIAGLRF